MTTFKTLENKKILLILPKYFGYENEIRKELEFFGVKVFMIFENMDEVNSFYRFVYVYTPQYKRKLMDRYYRKKIASFAVEFDYILVIRGASISCEVLEFLKGKYSSARRIMYQWDSVKNNPNALKIVSYFDKVITFDMCDAEKLGWTYRPLFFFATTERKDKRNYDICYICSLHSQRVKVYNKLLEKADSFNEFLYLYSKRIHFYKQKYFKHKEDFWGIEDNQIKFIALGVKDVNSIYAQSDIVVDYTNPGQSGFTMRTIESIGHRCKLVTNNKNVLDADFYNPSNVYVYDTTNFEIPVSFVNFEYEELSAGLYDKYSLRGWAKDVLGVLV